MNSTFSESNSGCDNMNTRELKNKIILFSVLAAMVPCIMENLLIPVISEMISENINISSSFLAGVQTLIKFFVAAIRLGLLVWGGYNITRTKEGAVRFVGIFAFSAAIASAVIGMFDFIEMSSLGEVAVAYIMLALNVLTSVVSAVINIRFFGFFEYRTENQYVTGAQLSLFRKKMVILLVAAYVLIFATSGVSAALVSVENVSDAGQLLTYALSIVLSVISMLVLLIIYVLALKVRGVKSDAIGFGGAYYMGALVTAPVTLLVTGFFAVLIDMSGNNILYMISSVVTALINMITSVISLVIMFKSLRIFFPVREIPVRESEDRAERILRNLIASKQDTETEN